ncbi:MAG: histidine kinase dimerization/phospho-acceptor domain-containing protein [Candidatus Electryonea clarkiae]|nr:histidine kinase dimerization/phospho-acceptor domain-containing protein [Candidatus Electryonea clarkiae]MDP8285943.1 histidine kinase dimerization/phospho-acceptor domain-containing protein [Candidatus Electryonea clarkiae]
MTPLFKSRCIYFIILLINFSTLFATNPEEEGLPFLQTYTPDQYGALSQNTCVIQTSDGILYFANLKGILQFDGVRWNLIEHPDGIQPLSLAVDSLDRVFVSFDQDLCILKRNSSNQPEIVSLKQFIPDSLIDISTVWSTHSTPDGIYFEGWRTLFRWQPSNQSGDEGKMSLWTFPAEKPYLSYTYWNDRHVVAQQDVGLIEIIDDSLVKIQGGQEFKDKNTYKLIPLGKDSLLIAGHDKNEKEVWFIYNGKKAKPFDTEIYKYALKHSGTEISRLTENQYLLVTTSGGMAVFNRRGDIEKILDRSTGLPDNFAYKCIADAEGGTWIPMDYGIARVKHFSSITWFGHQLGLDGTIFSIVRFKGRLYVCADKGVFVLEPSSSPGHPASFKQIDGIPKWSWGLLVIKNRLLVATDGGIYEITDINHKPRQISNRTSEFVVASRDSSRIYAGWDYEGIGSYRLENNHWIDEGHIEGTTGEVRELFVGDDGKLWLSVENKLLIGLIVEHQAGNAAKLVSETIYDSTKGLPSPDYFYPFTLNQNLVVGSSEGLYQYNLETDNFELDSSLFENQFPDFKDFSNPKLDYRGRIWFGGDPISAICAIPTGKEKYRIDLPFSHAPNFRKYAVYAEKDGIVWAGGPGGNLLRLDENLQNADSSSYKAYISKIMLADDSVIYTGKNNNNSKLSIIQYDKNDLLFEYFIPRYNQIQMNEYQYRLLRNNKYLSEWSNWSNEAYRHYDNLHEGKYCFEVRGRDAHRIISQTASFEFYIEPPWYRTWAAYGFYMLLAIIMVYLYTGLRTRKIVAQNYQLQQTIEETVAEAKSQFEAAKQVEIKAQKLQTANQLATTIAHEFNNPLAVMRGILDLIQMENDVNDDLMEDYKKLDRQITRMSELAIKLTTIEELDEVNYYEGTKMLNIHNSKDSSKSDNSSSSESME